MIIELVLFIAAIAALWGATEAVQLKKANERMRHGFTRRERSLDKAYHWLQGLTVAFVLFVVVYLLALPLLSSVLLWLALACVHWALFNLLHNAVQGNSLTYVGQVAITDRLLGPLPPLLRLVLPLALAGLSLAALWLF